MCQPHVKPPVVAPPSSTRREKDRKEEDLTAALQPFKPYKDEDDDMLAMKMEMLRNRHRADKTKAVLSASAAAAAANPAPVPAAVDVDKERRSPDEGSRSVLGRGVGGREGGGAASAFQSGRRGNRVVTPSRHADESSSKEEYMSRNGGTEDGDMKGVHGEGRDEDAEVAGDGGSDGHEDEGDSKSDSECKESKAFSPAVSSSKLEEAGGVPTSPKAKPSL
jgi:hypothetical protein